MSIWNLVTNALKQVWRLPKKVAKKLFSGFFPCTNDNSNEEATPQTEKENKMIDRFELQHLTTTTEDGTVITLHYFNKGGQRWFRLKDITYTSARDRYPGCDDEKPIILKWDDIVAFKYNKRFYAGCVYLAEKDIKKYIVEKDAMLRDRIASKIGNHTSSWSKFAARAIHAMFNFEVVIKNTFSSSRRTPEYLVLAERMKKDSEAREAYVRANRTRIYARAALRVIEKEPGLLESIFSKAEQQKGKDGSHTARVRGTKR